MTGHLALNGFQPRNRNSFVELQTKLLTPFKTTADCPVL